MLDRRPLRRPLGFHEAAGEGDGCLDGPPAFVGYSDRDPHIPLDRVQETTAVLSDLGADVDERIYEGMGHVVNHDEIDALSALVSDVVEH